PPPSTLFPYTTLFRSAGHPLHRLPQSQQRGLRAAGDVVNVVAAVRLHGQDVRPRDVLDEDEVHRGRPVAVDLGTLVVVDAVEPRSEEHTSELQSRSDL